MKKTITKAILMCAFTCVILLVIISFNDIRSIFTTLKKVNFGYLGLAFAVLAVYAGLSPIPLMILMKKSDQKISARKLYKISQTEFFFNGITPFAAGGQPFQVYSFKRAGVDANKSTGILLLNYVIYQTVVLLMCMFSLLYYKELNHLHNIKALIVIGFIINFIILGVFIGLGASKTVRRFLTWLGMKICKCRLFRKWLEPKIPAFDEYCKNVQEVFQDILHNKMIVFLCLIIKCVLQMIYFCIPFFILRSLGVELTPHRIFYVIAMTSFAVTMTCFIPTPGASGGIELAFKSIFISLAGVTNAIVVSSMLLWRLFTYYMLIAYGFVNYLSLEKTFSKEEKRALEQKTSEEKTL